jgi:hypothetical protein
MKLLRITTKGSLLAQLAVAALHAENNELAQRGYRRGAEEHRQSIHMEVQLSFRGLLQSE